MVPRAFRGTSCSKAPRPYTRITTVCGAKMDKIMPYAAPADAGFLLAQVSPLLVVLRPFSRYGSPEFLRVEI
jgi:hypothetical protein